MVRKSKLRLFPYIPFLFFSIFLALTGMLTYQYFAHGKTSIDARNPMLWGASLLLFGAFTAAYHFASASRTCSCCGSAKATDALFKDGRRSWLCRKDATRSIKDDLPSITGRWLVFAPAFEGVDDAGYVYCFESLANFEKYYKSPGVSDYPAAEIGRIKGKCLICGYPAEVSFFGSDSVIWERDGAFDLPDFSRPQAAPNYLCKNCAAAKVADGINAASCTFENGIFLPDGTDGVLFPWRV